MMNVMYATIEAIYPRTETAVCICPSSGGGEGSNTLTDFVQNCQGE
jgi:hypothetical protein